jgi:hypothetical protein
MGLPCWTAAAWGDGSLGHMRRPDVDGEDKADGRGEHAPSSKLELKTLCFYLSCGQALEPYDVYALRLIWFVCRYGKVCELLSFFGGVLQILFCALSPAWDGCRPDFVWDLVFCERVTVLLRCLSQGELIWFLLLYLRSPYLLIYLPSPASTLGFFYVR